MKLKKLFLAIPEMSWLSWLDACDYLAGLYVRASWGRRGLSLASTARLHYEFRSQIELDGRCSVGNFSVVLVAGSKQSISPPLLAIGDNVYIGDQTNLRAAGGVIRIGRNVLIANHVTIVASNHGTQRGKLVVNQDWHRGDVLIEDGVWIGAGVVVLPGAVIRQDAVIAAGAVVRGEVPSNTIYGGIPAHQIGVRS